MSWCWPSAAPRAMPARAMGAGSRREARALMRRLGTRSARSQGQLRLELLDSEADRA
ncbi:hypothetical protein [Janthinobacterium sp. BJB304]|uniref:hypothetical protein n=1 Tax=Janthinobacterium sp. BJB304 TaxID=1572871 RepID=UPI0015D491CC|nr:hypothetical protein [Janthinobacterium sp. BJB304]